MSFTPEQLQLMTWLIPVPPLLSFALIVLFTNRSKLLSHTVAILMGIELMLNAVNINLVAFWHYLTAQIMAGQMFTLIVLTVAAAEAAVGLALIISIYRRRSTVIAEEIDLLKW